MSRPDSPRVLRAWDGLWDRIPQAWQPWVIPAKAHARKLSARKIASAKTPGRYGDGGNLWLCISKTGCKSWSVRYRLAGWNREIGLGPVDLVSLAQAREQALEVRRQLRAGIDPLERHPADRR